MRLFSTSRVVRQVHKHDGTKWDCLVPQMLSFFQKHDGTKWDCLVPQWLSDNSTNSMGQNETVWYLKGCQTTSQTRSDKMRLFSTSMVVRQLHKHNGTKWDCLVPQWLSDHKQVGTKWDCLVPQGWSDIITKTIGQSETVWYLNGCQTTSGQSETV